MEFGNFHLKKHTCPSRRSWFFFSFCRILVNALAFFSLFFFTSCTLISSNDRNKNPYYSIFYQNFNFLPPLFDTATVSNHSGNKKIKKIRILAILFHLHRSVWCLLFHVSKVYSQIREQKKNPHFKRLDQDLVAYLRGWNEMFMRNSSSKKKLF